MDRLTTGADRLSLAADRLSLAADRLWDAQATGVPCAPVRDLVLDIDEAYAVQQHNVQRVLDETGATLVGRKIGLTSEAVQRQLGVDQPDCGALFEHLTSLSGEPVPMTGLLQPKAEAEVVLVLGSDLDTNDPTIEDVLAATAYLLPAIEIVDSRVAGWDITLLDTVADNASCGRLVLGSTPVATDAVDLVALPMSMTVNGEVASTGTGAACLGNPLIAAQWLASTMARLGTPLRQGDLVLTGALGPMAPVVAGDSVVADLAGLGTVSVTFEQSSTEGAR